MALKPEEVLQINVINWFNHTYPDLEDDLLHIANERYLPPTKSGSHWQAGRKLKRMGVKKGVADLHLAIPLDGYSGLWLELKTETGVLEPEQKEFLARKQRRGYMALAVWGIDAAKAVFKDYLRNMNSNSDQNKPNQLINNKPIC